ncbi:Ger(x)C family spore germination protein [Brevibacillus brevis]|uniref:Ger(x)C family spore germination protein n=1 Tax=Brevibacillus brevis TaxID=1393 RepID=UPI000D0EBB6B|nr:Ger(x)C family spore germination protein [Brevibacillus brevis]PSJ71201.1 Ger(x)C family spore germination protein [Brevibacillus brevis]RED28806.1 spore germination protein KC [Brevibacillus brevis]GEC89809.1 spore germination protein KC [Brevibacillus brevis]VEF91599.1 Spore germination protein B3 precursor [Brevibacillus brevis]
MKRKGVFLLALTLLVLMTGCWNRRELNDLAIVMGTGIDKIDGQYVISAQIVNPGAVASTESGKISQSAVATYSMRGSSIFEGIRRMTTETPRRLYFSHIQVLVLGEQVAREGIKEALDLLFRDHEVRPDFYVILAKDTTALQILSMIDPLEKIPATKLYKSLETGEKAWGSIVSMRLDEVIADLLREGVEPVLVGATLKGKVRTGSTDISSQKDSQPNLLRYQDIGVFKKDKLLGWLNEEESIGFSYITDKVDSTVEEIPCDKKHKIVVEIIRSKTTVNGKVKNGNPQIEVSVSAEGNVGEVACPKDLSNPQTIYKLEADVEKRIREKIVSAIHKTQKQYHSDVLGFGQSIYHNDPKGWKKVKEDWDSKFTDLNVKVKVDVRLRRTGKVGNSFIPFIKKD